MLYVVEAGLPKPLVNPWIFDRSWVLRGRPDLYDPLIGHSIEYDGAYHDDPAQRERDRVRQQRFADLEISVTRVGRTDLGSHLGLCSLLRHDRLHVSRSFDPGRIHVVPASGLTQTDGRPVPPGVLDLISRLSHPQV